MKTKLCCIFNYAPLYRKSIFKKIDEEFDAQFCFGDIESDIAKVDYDDFKRSPLTVRDRKFLGKILWRRDICSLPFKSYDHYLITGDMSLSYFPFIILCHLLGKKVYAWGHGNKSLGRGLKWFVRWFYNHCDAFFTYGARGRSRLIELGFSEQKIHVIYNSLNAGVNFHDNKAFFSPVIRNHFGNDLPTIVFVGRLTKVKQLDMLIQAQDFHMNRGLGYNVLFIGDGQETQRLKEMVRNKARENYFWFYGACYDDNELSILLYNADLCVSPGNVGLTALHAMSYGTPVISHNDFETQMPEYEAIISGRTGELYEKGDFNDFCHCIEKWLSAAYDRDLVRQNCYDVINDKFNSEYQIRLLKKIIR